MDEAPAFQRIPELSVRRGLFLKCLKTSKEIVLANTVPLLFKVSYEVLQNEDVV